MRRIYISGKISGCDYAEAFKKFDRAEVWLLTQAYLPVNPMKKVSEQEGKSWKEYMLEDIAILWDCDAIYLLSDWQDSQGARIELGIAQELGLEVIYESARQLPESVLRVGYDDEGKSMYHDFGGGHLKTD